jgi:hypothetical protein
MLEIFFPPFLEFFIKLDTAINDRMNPNATWKRLVGIFCDLPPGAEALDVRIQIVLSRNDTSLSPYSFGSLQKASIAIRS